MPKDPKDLGEVVKELDKIDSEEFPDAKAVVNRRNYLRELLRQYLDKRQELPKDSSYFAGLVRSSRISWKQVACTLAERANLTEEDKAALYEECTNYKPRIKYGRSDEFNKFQQLEFDFLTPPLQAVEPVPSEESDS